MFFEKKGICKINLADIYLCIKKTSVSSVHVPCVIFFTMLKERRMQICKCLTFQKMSIPSQSLELKMLSSERQINRANLTPRRAYWSRHYWCFWRRRHPPDPLSSDSCPAPKRKAKDPKEHHKDAIYNLTGGFDCRKDCCILKPRTEEYRLEIDNGESNFLFLLIFSLFPL